MKISFIFLWVCLVSSFCNAMHKAAGVLPYAWHYNEPCILFAQEAENDLNRALLWNSFGGRAYENETLKQTACRKASEETRYVFGNSLMLLENQGFSPELLHNATITYKKAVTELEHYGDTCSKQINDIVTEASKNSRCYFSKKIKSNHKLVHPRTGYTVYFVNVKYIDPIALKNAPLVKGCNITNYAWIPVSALCKSIERLQKEFGQDAYKHLHIPNFAADDAITNHKVFSGCAQLLMSPLGHTMLNYILKLPTRVSKQ